MSQKPPSQTVDEERAELERVVDALTQPRLSRLLRYMGEKVLSGQEDQLNEYNIATEVLGRPKTVFNAAEDAIARVETHRLRKRLAEFYEEAGKHHPIQVTLPAGSYVPVFVRRSEAPAPVRPAPSHLRGLAHPTETRRPWFFGHGKFVGLLAAVALTAAATYWYVHSPHSSETTTAVANPVANSVSTPPESGPLSAPVRLLAGYDGPPRTDSAGRIWSPDQYFAAGGTWRRSSEFLARTSDPFIFDHFRTGDFHYNIPLKPGSYELHLFFTTSNRSDQLLSAFNVDVNGKRLLVAFDVNADALGANIADERVFRDISPDSDGTLHVVFSGANSPPAINAIEVIPSVPHATLPIRLIMQTIPLTDHEGHVWRPDNYFMEGRLSGPAHPLMNSPDPDLFAGERYGHFSYAIPVDTRDRYTLVLHFAEFYFGSGASGNGGVGSRVFKVMCNGETLLDDFDIYKEVGTLREITKTFRHLKPSPQGKLNLTFEPIVNNATISGIEVLDEGK